MRFQKLSLIAAAALVVGGFAHAASLGDGQSQTVDSLSGDWVLGAGSTLTVSAVGNGTFAGKVSGTGDLVKTGGGTLLWGSYVDVINPLYYLGKTYENRVTRYSSIANSAYFYYLQEAEVVFLGSDEFDDTDTAKKTAITTGNLRVTGGVFGVSGYINQWVDMRRVLLAYNDVTPAPTNPDDWYRGFKSTVLENDAMLSFRNMRQNLSTKKDVVDGRGEAPGEPTKSLNFVRNLKAGDANTATNTALEVGGHDYDRLDVHIDTGVSGGIGSLRGTGRLYKTGAGSFDILNDGNFVGDMFILDGHVSLRSPFGASLATAASVNLGGSNRGNNPGGAIVLRGASLSGFDVVLPNTNILEWRPDYVVKYGDGAAEVKASAALNIATSQTIRNLQAKFFEGQSSMSAAAATSVDEPYIVNSGDGSRILIANGATLTIKQDLDGYYTGNLEGRYGKVVKEGAGTLGLFGSAGDVGELIINQGALLANVQSLGTGTITVNGGSLSIIQNTTGTLQASLGGSVGGTLLFTTQGTLKNPSDVIVDAYDQFTLKGLVGTVDIIRAQDAFTGTVEVTNGIIVAFHSPGGDTFKNASAIHLLRGDDGLETRLSFFDSNQTFRNFTGEAGTWLDLGRGTVTLVQSVNGGYSGKVSGVGNFVKTGAGRFTLDGRDALGVSLDSYYGATVVREGNLTLGGANQLPNTSGLVLGGGTVSVTGNQRFGALFGAAGTTLAMGAGHLTIGYTESELARLSSEIAALPAGLNAPAAGYYFDTGAGLGLAGTSVDITKDFLKAQGVAASAADNLAFAGVISGSGALVKIGAEKLTLTGVNTYTGETQLLGGSLGLNVDSINASSALKIANLATVFLNADTGVVGTFVPPVSGDGLLRKIGAGEITIEKPFGLTSGAVEVREGALRLTMAGPSLLRFDVSGIAGGVNAGDARLIFDQATDVRLTSPLRGDGILEKEGAGKLELTGSFFTGDVRVKQGTLALGLLPAGDLEIANGALLEAGIATDPTFSGLLLGEGELRVSGGTLTLNRVSTAFTGTLTASGATLVTAVNNVYPKGRINLTNASTLDLSGRTQALSGINASADSVIQLNHGVLVVITPEGETGTVSGRILGQGVIQKDGLGTLRLVTEDVAAWTGTLQVRDGTLEATPFALGAAQVQLDPTATFALRNDDAASPLDYANVIIGDGVIGKLGSGTISLTNGSPAFGGEVHISQGELRLAAGGLGGRVFPSVTFAENATPDAVFAVALTAPATLDKAATSAFVQGPGSLAIEGAQTLTLRNGQSYRGNTILRQGAKLNLTDASFGTTLNGLAGETGTEVINGATLTINQNVTGSFAGDFRTPVALTVTNSKANGAKLTLDSTANPNIFNGIASITVGAEGHLVLDAAATKPVTLDGGTLYFDTTRERRTYAGGVTGTGTVVKTGAQDLELVSAADVAAFAHTGRIGVDQGRLTLSVDDGILPASITGLYTAGSGTLTLQVRDDGVADFVATRRLSGPGALAKTGGGLLRLGSASGAYTIDSTGDFTVEQGTLGGRFTTSGNLVVESAGILAPGNSPGLVTVNGDLALAGTLAMELTDKNAVAGTDYDRVQVNGRATLGGVLRVTQFGAAAPVRGLPYAIITTTGGVTGEFASIDTSTIAGVTGRKLIVVTPDRNADINGPLLGLGNTSDVIVYVVDDLAATPGYAQHDGLKGLSDQLNAFVDGTAGVGLPSNRLGARLGLTSPGALNATVNSLSPLGYGSLYAMGRETGLRQEEQIRSRLEQRRYDNAGERNDPWEAFIVGSGAIAANDAGTDTPVFDYNTAGGLVGLDRKIENGPVVGVAAGYDNGTATLHDGAGKITMSRVRGTAFLSTMVNRAWFLDASVSAGVADYAAKRNAFGERNTGDTTGFDFGASLATGTIVVLRSDLHLTPYVAASYSHHEFDGFTEKGSMSRLAADSWSNDSLRASVGTGLGWWKTVADMKLKLGVDVAYNRELLDTESDITARFAQLGGSAFRTTAAALPSDSISVSPNVSLGVDEASTVSAGYTFEHGFDGRLYNAFNVAYRRRF